MHAINPLWFILTLYLRQGSNIYYISDSLRWMGGSPTAQILGLAYSYEVSDSDEHCE